MLLDLNLVKVFAERKIFVAVNTLMGILPLGFFMSVYYYLPRDPERRETIIHHVFFFNLAMGAFGCLLLTIFPQLLGWLFEEPALTGYAPVIGFIGRKGGSTTWRPPA